jgi:uncharacterized membrane protein YphA (DoxX/SURF4 family)
MKNKISSNSHKIIAEICRVFLGLVFVFSGFVKAIDPWGGAYKITDYFLAFGLNMFDFMAVPFSFILVMIEFTLGVCLLSGVYRKYTSTLVLIFMIFMTPLTLYLAISNPVTDCGCFGDALVISNWQTFFKNIFLLSAAIILSIWSRSITAFFSHRSYSLVALWIMLFILSFTYYSYSHLPIVDFRPYKIGANIPELMVIPENADNPVYETTLIYSKDGERKEFTLENYPKTDDWQFVDSKSKLIKKGYEPPIHDFSIVSKRGDDVTDDLLSNPSYSFLLIAHKLEGASNANASKINEIYNYSSRYGYGFYAITASSSTDIQNWVDITGAEYSFYTMDDIALKTIIRSNPGLVLLKDGVIINKWSNKNLPKSANLIKPIEETGLGEIPSKHGVINVLFWALILIVPLLALWKFDIPGIRKKR